MMEWLRRGAIHILLTMAFAQSVFLKCLKRIWLETPLQLRRLWLHFCVDFP